MLDRLHVLIMAGGSGTRFWPRSRRNFPKQLLSMTGDRTLLEQTVARVQGLGSADRVWVMTRHDLVDAVRRTLPQLSTSRLIAEPELRDTASALVLAAARVEQVDPEAILLVLPADHSIPDADAFCSCVRGAVDSLAIRDGLITFGIPAIQPEVSYGYIERGDDPVPAGCTISYAVRRFVEKPPLDEARAFVASGRFYWNGGIFIWRLPTFKNALRQHSPEHARGWERLAELGEELSNPESTLLADRFGQLPRVSIDYALMERAEGVRVVEANFGWDDVGSWRALERHRAADPGANLTEGRVLLEDCRECTVFASSDRVIAGLGLEGLVVIDTPDALLVCPRDRVDEVKKLTAGLAERAWDDVL
ncbi:MAG: mannose-1-phosphate guanylyltransferase [Planctomycetes bacterium]|nr:mannose-1-phosphate guanylyltransferase [Planctomycetota bacterium]